MDTPVRINQLVYELIQNFCHLLPITGEPLTKDEFLAALDKTYDTQKGDARLSVFKSAVQQCIFETIRYDRSENTIYFNTPAIQ